MKMKTKTLTPDLLHKMDAYKARHEFSPFRRFGFSVQQ